MLVGPSQCLWKCASQPHTILLGTLYHAPTKFCNVIQDIYTDLRGCVMTSEWTTDMFNMDIGVFQGDPLSVLIFNTVMNTYIDTITINHRDTGYCFSKSNHRVNLLQYADDTCLLADGPAPCRQLLETTNQWLRWSGMNPQIPKCCSLAIQASTGTSFNPELSLNDTPIPYLGDSTINFLGAPVSFVRKKMDIRQSVKTKLEVLLQRVDASLVTRQQKLRLYKLAVCPRLTWELSINSFPITFVEKELMAFATRYLKKWAGLAKPADPSCLYLPKSTGGLELPSLVTIYKKLQTSKAATLMMSQDSTVRHLASSLTLERKREAKRSISTL